MAFMVSEDFVELELEPSTFGVEAHALTHYTTTGGYIDEIINQNFRRYLLCIIIQLHSSKLYRLFF